MKLNITSGIFCYYELSHTSDLVYIKNHIIPWRDFVWYIDYSISPVWSRTELQMLTHTEERHKVPEEVNESGSIFVSISPIRYYAFDVSKLRIWTCRQWWKQSSPSQSHNFLQSIFMVEGWKNLQGFLPHSPFPFYSSGWSCKRPDAQT